MIAVVSPAKTLDFDSPSQSNSYSQCDFLNESSKLVNETKKLEKEDLKRLMNISDKLASLNSDRFQNWSIPFNIKNSKQAIFAFQGDTYTGLNANSFDSNDLSYAQNHFRILSGLYGLLKPLDLIQPYRLEMGIKLKIETNKNLYEFWSNKISLKLNEELKKHKNKTIINCASNEYFKSVDLKTLNGKVITPIFKDIKNGVPKLISFYAKKARGMMSRYIIQNKIEKTSDLLDFNTSGYLYSRKDSSEINPVFIRKEKSN
tara:strand:+ start:13181 stop:13960 length:780 start_codon:yes stop_codon:yes gene_type:complete